MEGPPPCIQYGPDARFPLETAISSFTGIQENLIRLMLRRVISCVAARPDLGAAADVGPRVASLKYQRGKAACALAQ